MDPVPPGLASATAPLDLSSGFESRDRSSLFDETPSELEEEKAQERYKSQKKSKDVDGTKVVSEVEDLKMRNEGHVEDGFFTVSCEDGDLGLQIEPWPPASQVWIRKVSKDGWAQKMGIKLGDELLMLQKQPLKIFEVRGGTRLF